MANPLGTLGSVWAIAAVGFFAASATAQELDRQPQHPLAGHQIVEAQANTFTYQRQMDQSLDVDSEGRVLVAWGSRRQEHGTFGVFAQLFDALGRPLGTEIHVNEFMLGNQMEPAVAFGPDGSAWVAWCSIPAQDGHMGGIYMRRMAYAEAEDGYRFEPVSDEILVNETTVGDQQEPSLTVDALGNVLVGWTSDHAGDRYVMARRFDAFGKSLDGEFRVSDAQDRFEGMPALASLEGGRSVIAWQNVALDGQPLDLEGRIIEADGSFGGDAFVLNELDGRQHVEPSIDSDADGNFVVAWMSAGADAEWEVSARRFAAEGLQASETITLHSHEGGRLSGAHTAMHRDGRFVVAYNDFAEKRDFNAERPTHEIDIVAQVFSAEGEALGERVRVNQFTPGEQSLQIGLNSRRIAWSDLDQIAVSWHGKMADDGRAVALTLFAPESLDVETPPMVEPVAVMFDRDDYYAQESVYPEWDPNWVPEPFGTPRSSPAGADFGFQAFSSTGWNPPDPDLAVGPNHIVAVVNVDMRFFDKQGNQTFNTGLESFFGTSGFVFDPVALYDEHNDRFVIACAEHFGSVDYFTIAVSDDNDPNGTWHKYRVNVDSICGFLDFENLGVTADTYSVVADCFSGQGDWIHIVDKASILNGGTLSKNSRQLHPSFASSSSIRSYDANNDTVYSVSAFASGSPRLRIYGYTDPNGSATKNQFDLNVGSFSSPPNAQQLGSSSTLDTIDVRIKNGVVRDDMMYLCHNVNGGDGAAKVRWYRIDLNGWPTSGSNPTLEDSGDIDEGTNIDTWFGDVNVDAAGNMAIAFNRSSPNERVGVWRTYRLTTDAPGTVRAGVVQQTSTQADTSGRWGDYAGLEEDPAVPGTFWNHHPYRESSWRTWVGNFALSGGAPGPLDLTISTFTGGLPATATTTGANAGAEVFVYYSFRGFGSTFVPSLNVTLGIDRAKSVGSSIADSSGTAVFSGTVPASASGRLIYIQTAAQDTISQIRIAFIG